MRRRKRICFLCFLSFFFFFSLKVKKIVDLMEQKKVDSKRVAFGQLLGMCDHVSLSLGKAGYLVYKYVPYGPVKEVVPYLIRRAEENSTLLGSPGVQREKAMIFRELFSNRLNPFAKKT